MSNIHFDGHLLTRYNLLPVLKKQILVKTKTVKVLTIFIVFYILNVSLWNQKAKILIYSTKNQLGI